MTVFSSSLTNAEKHLLYIAKDKEEGKKSPVDYEVKLHAKRATISDLGNAVNSTLSGAYSALFTALGFSAVYPLLPTATRATIMGANYEKVNAAMAENLENLSKLFSSLRDNLVGAQQGTVDFINSFGIPLNELPFTGEDSYLRSGLGKVETYLTDWKASLESDAKILWDASQNATKVNGTNTTAFEGAPKAAGYLVGPRTINYLGSVVETASWIAEKVQEHSYGLFIAAGVVGVFAAWNFANTHMNRGAEQKKAIELVTANFEDMLEKLQELSAKAKENRSAIMNEEVFNLARGILEHEDQVYTELNALKLSDLDHRKQKALFAQLLKEAEKIVNNYSIPTAG